MVSLLSTSTQLAVGRWYTESFDLQPLKEWRIAIYIAYVEMDKFSI
jgi:hypothetical protein